jgi:maltose-binding protein MalE
VTGLVNEPVFAQHPVLPEMEALLAYGHPVPASPAYVRLRVVLTAYMLRVESGNMEPGPAVAAAVDELQQILGEQLVVEQ